jgi:hypothetical protein
MWNTSDVLHLVAVVQSPTEFRALRLAEAASAEEARLRSEKGGLAS